jgi:hypothetical protein
MSETKFEAQMELIPGAKRRGTIPGAKRNGITPRAKLSGTMKRIDNIPKLALVFIPVISVIIIFKIKWTLIKYDI